LKKDFKEVLRQVMALVKDVLVNMIAPSLHFSSILKQSQNACIKCLVEKVLFDNIT
jgi:hypothetical protein